MKKSINLALALVALAVALSMGSCEILGNLFNKPPVVSLAITSDGSDDDLWSDETVTVTATMSDPDGDTVSYKWYLNGTAQEATDSVINYTASSVTSSTTDTLSITVDDGNGETATDSIAFSVSPSSTLYIYNNSSTVLNRFYMVAHPYGYNGNWGSDWLGTSTLSANGGIVKFIGISQGSYNLKWEYSGGSTFTLTTACGFANGDPRTLQLSNNTLYGNVVSGPLGRISSGAFPRQSVFAPAE